MTKRENLIRTHRIIQYNRFRKPSNDEFQIGFEYEYLVSFNTYNCLKDIPSHLKDNDYTVTKKGYTPMRWVWAKVGHFGIFNINTLKEMNNKGLIRAKMEFTTKELANLLDKYPLKFKYRAKDTISLDVIVLPRPNRQIILNKDNFKREDNVEFFKDWQGLLLNKSMFEKSCPKLPNKLWKYFDGIYIEPLKTITIYPIKGLFHTISQKYNYKTNKIENKTISAYTNVIEIKSDSSVFKRVIDIINDFVKKV